MRTNIGEFRQMSKSSRRDFIKQSLSLAVLASTTPTLLLARIEPVSYRKLGNGMAAGTYTLKVSDFPTFDDPTETKKYGLTEVGSSIKLTSLDELLMNPDHCERSGKDGEDYPIAIVRVKESGEDAFTAVSTWCPHNSETQLDHYDYGIGGGLFVCSHQESSYRADGTWVPPAESPFSKAPALDEFAHNIGPDGKPHLTSFRTFFDGVDTLTIYDVLCECADCPSSVVEEETSSFRLHQNYPNPASGLTIFRFVLPTASHVLLSILTLEGKVVDTPVDSLMEGGSHMVDYNVKELASGTYFFKLETSFGTKTRRMTVVK